MKKDMHILIYKYKYIIYNYSYKLIKYQLFINVKGVLNTSCYDTHFFFYVFFSFLCCVFFFFFSLCQFLQSTTVITYIWQIYIIVIFINCTNFKINVSITCIQIPFQHKSGYNFFQRHFPAFFPFCWREEK